MTNQNKSTEVQKNKRGRRRDKITEARKNKMLQIMEMLEEDLDNDIRELEPKERVKLYERLMEYNIPKLSKVEAEVKKEKIIDVTAWAEESGQVIDAEVEDDKQQKENNDNT